MLTPPLSKNSSQPGARRFRRRRLGRRGAFAVEFAMVAPLFFILLFVVFEIAYDEFMQEVLDNTILEAARQVQIGNTSSATPTDFVSTYVCPYDGGLLSCNNIYIRLQQVNFDPGDCSNIPAANTGDYYDATNGVLPLEGTQLELGSFYSGAGTAGTGDTVGLSPCESTGSSSGFCNPIKQETMLLTAVYVAPSFLDGLILNHILFNGHYVRAQIVTSAFETEPFSGAPAHYTC